MDAGLMHPGEVQHCPGLRFRGLWTIESAHSSPTLPQPVQAEAEAEAAPHHSRRVGRDLHPKGALQEAHLVALVPSSEQRLRLGNQNPPKQEPPQKLARPQPGSATTIKWWQPPTGQRTKQDRDSVFASM